MLRKSKKPVVLAVNKVDSFQKFGNDVYEFYNLESVIRLNIGSFGWGCFSAVVLEDGTGEEEKTSVRELPLWQARMSEVLHHVKLLGNRVIVSDIAGIPGMLWIRRLSITERNMLIDTADWAGGEQIKE